MGARVPADGEELLARVIHKGTVHRADEPRRPCCRLPVLSHIHIVIFHTDIVQKTSKCNPAWAAMRSKTPGAAQRTKGTSSRQQAVGKTLAIPLLEAVGTLYTA